jgi:glycine dehydrogenase
MVAELTGLDIAGASLLDESTAVAEAVAMARRLKPKRPARVVVDAQLLPQTLAVLRTRTHESGVEVVVANGPLIDESALSDCVAVVVQTPELDGRLQPTGELRALAEKAHEAGALVIAAADLLALTLIAPPGQWGADIAVGNTQRFGVPLSGGGPHAGYIACRKGMERQLPGRLVGVSIDADGAPAVRLALQTREQHIRREKATSNICTAQVLLAVVAAMYAVYHGPEGLRRIARTINERTRVLAGVLAAGGFTPVHESFFDTLLVPAPGRAAQIVADARDAGVHLRLRDADTVGISVGEDATEADFAAILAAFGLDTPTGPVTPWGTLGAELREADYLLQPTFNTYHSETQMMRYLHTLKGRDFALDQGMIPLGSCTMKLNPAVAVETMTLPGFTGVHPFAPAADRAGFQELIDELGAWLCSITGYDAITFQPNSGATGEYTGLTAIRRYHESRGQANRNICLIPSSAHGTNAASAAMAGLQVVVVKAAEDGSVDLDDLAAKIAEHGPNLAAIMVTYPSTHGVFEDTITPLCKMVHDAGGQVYIDGANINALAGWAKPGEFGGDVSHLNLHKTFAIPHGGGGPGVGPVACRSHLAPFLPSHPMFPDYQPDHSDTITEAPYGSIGVVPISYAYIAMLGESGLREASAVAVLNANYIALRLGDAYPVLYTGNRGLVAHECIIDLRPLTAQTHVSVDDVAKRLIDYGFHAPTMAFPVAGTLMVEPTESEDLGELDRFCDAMLAIRAEIDEVASGSWPADDNPLVNAPHTLQRVTAEEWSHPYSRAVAAFPKGQRVGLAGGGTGDKYWPASARIDNTYGDRHLVTNLPTE